MKIIAASIIRWTLCAIFAYAGLVKAMHVLSFYHDIRMYNLFSDEAAWLWANYLPWLEMVASAGLMIRWTRAAACLIILLLLLTFMSAVLSAWVRGLHIECGCFGENAGTSHYLRIVLRDLLMVAVAAYLLKSTLAERYRHASALPSV